MTPKNKLEMLIEAYRIFYGLTHPKARQAIRSDLRAIFNERYRKGERPA